MAIEWKYRGRVFNLADIQSIQRLIAANPEASRWALSRRLCEVWNWKQPNGALRDMVCRGLLLMLQRAGAIELPPVRRHPPGNGPLSLYHVASGTDLFRVICEQDMEGELSRSKGTAGASRTRQYG